MTSVLFAILLFKSPIQPADVVSSVRKALTGFSNLTASPETLLSGTSNFRGISSAYELKFEPDGRCCPSQLRLDEQLFGSEGRHGHG